MDRLDDHVSATYWMQCDDCRRAWAVPRPLTIVPRPPDHKNSPDS